MSVTVITCTGDRHKAFALCKQHVMAQTFRNNVEWLVVDDGADMVDTSHIDTYIRMPHRPGVNTLNDNFTIALQAASGEFLVVFEDDDYYAPNYIETVLEFLGRVKLVGVREVTYYNLKGLWRPIRNQTYAPLAFTAFDCDLIPLMLEAMDGGPYKTFDIGFWRLAAKEKITTLMYKADGLCVGVKGFPGRAGIGLGHRNLEHSTWRVDADKSKAKELFGPAFELYEPFIGSI